MHVFRNEVVRVQMLVFVEDFAPFGEIDLVDLVWNDGERTVGVASQSMVLWNRDGGLVGLGFPPYDFCCEASVIRPEVKA